MRGIVVVSSLLLAFAMACHVSVDANSRPPPGPVTRTIPEGPAPTIDGNHETVQLAEGKYKGDLVVTGNHNTILGAGYGKTIIKGHLLMTGNHNTVSGMTVEAGGTVEGNHNDATKVEFHGDVTTAPTKPKSD